MGNTKGKEKEEKQTLKRQQKQKLTKRKKEGKKNNKKNPNNNNNKPQHQADYKFGETPVKFLNGHPRTAAVPPLFPLKQ